jgi:UDP-N-acetylmuramate: L-alanyl-gamma-D-glutamyl-meso-diaminopimelate ligase
MTQGRHVHLIGICGSAMASLAGMLQLRGWRVTGSDKAAYPPMSTQLEAMKIPVAQPFDARHLEPAPDLVIIGNAISRGNPELEEVLDRRIPFASLAATIHDEFLRGRESLVVAGTHGKTTTTSMLAWIYETASADEPELAPSFLIGGIAENFGSSFAVRPTRPFILEGDEYDTAFFDKGPKFLHYFPDRLILTHVEFDHADIYADLDAVKTAFKRLINLVPRRGRIVAYDAPANVSECVAKAFCPVERYGFQPGSHWRITDFSTDARGSRWSLQRAGAEPLRLAMPLAGEHNVLNATGAAALALGAGIQAAAVQRALASFRSVKRRLEVVAEVGGVTIIDDFAHHPTAIRETLRALRLRYPSARIWAVLEPRSNTLRRNIFEQELADSLKVADEIVLAAVYQAANVPTEKILDSARVIAGLQAEGAAARQMPDVLAINEFLAANVRRGDVVAILSNGGFDGIYQSLPQRLRRGGAPAAP